MTLQVCEGLPAGDYEIKKAGEADVEVRNSTLFAHADCSTPLSCRWCLDRAIHASVSAENITLTMFCSSSMNVILGIA